MIQDATVNQH